MTRAEARRFGLVVGTAFVVLAILLWWRGHALALYLALAAAVTLLVLAAVAPPMLRPIHRAWMAFGLRMSRITTPVLMGIVFFAIILPVGLVRRMVGSNPVVHPERNSSFWATRDPSHRRSNLNRQF